jgi:copper chaperone
MSVSSLACAEVEQLGTERPKENTYEFNVKMTCSGCSGAVNRALSKAEGVLRLILTERCINQMFHYKGVTSYDVNLEQQTVVVKGPATYDYIYEKIKKTGKEVSENLTALSVQYVDHLQTCL